MDSLRSEIIHFRIMPVSSVNHSPYKNLNLIWSARSALWLELRASAGTDLNAAYLTSINAPRLSLEDFLKEDEIIQYGASDEDGIVEDLRISLSRIGLPATVSKNLPNPTETTGDGNHKFEPSPLKVLEPYATYTILNTETQANLRRSIDSNHLHRLRTSLRPAWDEYFMTLANLASLRSNCMKRRVGAVLITKRDKRVLSTGYNGTPRGMSWVEATIISFGLSSHIHWITY